MAKLLINDLFEDINDENKRLLTELMFSQKSIDLMKNQRKLLIDFNNSCICDQNFGQKMRFNELEVQYKTIESEIQDIENRLEENKRRNDELMAELALNSNPKRKPKQFWFERQNFRKRQKSSTNYTDLLFGVEEEDKRLAVNDSSGDSEEDIDDSDEDYNDNSIEGIPKQRSFICGYNKCPNTYPTRHEVLAHIKSCHTMNENKRSRTQPEKDRPRHTKERPFKCLECNKSFAIEESLRAHQQNHSIPLEDRRYRCEYSGCTFETRYPHNLNEHYLRHQNIRNFKCNESGCEKSFLSRSDLKRHTNTVHSTERPFKCDWPGCEARYKCRQLWNNHRLTHLNERKFKCDFMGCQKTFVTGKALFGHKQQHLKPYLCNWPACGQRFGSNRSLKTHMNRHQNIKPFKCEFNGCDKCFFSKPELNQHLKHSHNYSFFPINRFQ